MKHLWIALTGALMAGQALAIELTAADLVAQRCSTCHGAQGQSSSPIFPSLAAQNPQYVAKQLHFEFNLDDVGPLDHGQDGLQCFKFQWTKHSSRPKFWRAAQPQAPFGAAPRGNGPNLTRTPAQDRVRPCGGGIGLGR